MAHTSVNCGPIHVGYVRAAATQPQCSSRLSLGYAYVTMTYSGTQTVQMSYVTVTVYARGAQVGTIPHGYADQVAPGASVDVSPPIDIVNAFGGAAQNASSCSAAVS